MELCFGSGGGGRSLFCCCGNLQVSLASLIVSNLQCSCYCNAKGRNEEAWMLAECGGATFHFKLGCTKTVKRL